MKSRWISMWAIVALIVGCLTLPSCGSPQVRFVVPDGHRGYVTVVLDGTNGQDPIVQNGVRIFSSDETGCIRVKSFDAFNDWHQLQTVTSGGVVIPNGHATEAPATAILSYGLGESSGGKRYYFIGTRAEYKAAASAPLP